MGGHEAEEEVDVPVAGDWRRGPGTGRRIGGEGEGTAEEVAGLPADAAPRPWAASRGRTSAAPIAHGAGHRARAPVLQLSRDSIKLLFVQLSVCG